MDENEIKSEIFTLDRFEDRKAVLIGEHFEILIPKKLIPKKLNEGDIVHLTLSSDEAETKKREQSAKDILNELLKS
ncbi:hypothetical protein A2215_03625 [Candidatus Berkelbacteria bacterium RIFOXYA2_FULL_43_10]|uniref:DUF3006 domain-containing protein n=1 Tax=Candidatus Berkelbacteria bacterium RIFOXYA2_FULL_43_10 TaxID=1797472 RepID=A0A1F5EDV5_9BACT|nr:MAG: hypothetical protein A2215_03625 [Candidatus Berkelbacteria bacterium RIFOXYA2_FULL_43_10]